MPDLADLPSQIGLKKWRGLSNALVWIIGPLLFAAASIRELYPLIYEYSYNNVATQMHFIAGNTTVKPPVISLCLDFPLYNASSISNIANRLIALNSNETSVCPECDALAGRGWDVWRGIELPSLVDPNIDEISHLIIAGLIKKLINDTYANVDVLNSSNARWNRPIVEALWFAFGRLAESDSAVNTSADAINTTVAELDRYGLARLLEDDPLIEQLFESFMDVFCEHIQMLYPPRGPNRARYCMHHLSGFKASVFDDAICFALPPMDEGYLLYISAKSEAGSYWAMLDSAESKVEAFLTPSVVSWPRAYDHIQPLYASNFAPGKLAPQELVHMRYSVAMSMREKRPRHEHNCYPESGPAECVGGCMVSKITETCGCSLFSFRESHNITPHSPYCNITYHTSCEIDRWAELQNCEKRCTDPCEYVSYQWNTAIETGSRGSFRKFRMFAIPLATPFVEFWVTVRDTPEQFITRAGSVLNLNLGVSGLTVVAVAAYVVNLIAQWWWTKTVDRNVASSPSSAETTSAIRNAMGSSMNNYNYYDYGMPKNAGTSAPGPRDEMGSMRQELAEMKEAITNLKGKLDLLTILPNNLVRLPTVQAVAKTTAVFKKRKQNSVL